jgi:hypothetical protein
MFPSPQVPRWVFTPPPGMPQQYIDTAIAKAAAQGSVPAQPVPQPSNPPVGDGVVQPEQPGPQPSNPPVGDGVVQPEQPGPQPSNPPVGDGVVQPEQPGPQPSNPPVGDGVVQPEQPGPQPSNPPVGNGVVQPGSVHSPQLKSLVHHLHRLYNSCSRLHRMV